MMRTSRVTITLALLTSAAPALTQDTDAGPPLGRMVDVDGRRLHLHCSGSSAPTVVVEAGASSFAIDFALVQPEVAKATRVCSYDRAGSGWSEAAPTSRRRSGLCAICGHCSKPRPRRDRS